MVYKSGQIFLPFCHNSRVWRKDRRTDGRTEFSSQYRVCITCSAVKMELKNRSYQYGKYRFKTISCMLHLEDRRGRYQPSVSMRTRSTFSKSVMESVVDPRAVAVRRYGWLKTSYGWLAAAYGWNRLTTDYRRSRSKHFVGDLRHFCLTVNAILKFERICGSATLRYTNDRNHNKNNKMLSYRRETALQGAL